MADNTTLNSGSGGDIIKTEDTGAGFKIPVSKIYTGAADVNGGPVTTANPFPTQPQSGSLISLLVGGQINTPANPVPVSAQSGSVTGLLVGGLAVSKANFVPTQPQSGSLTAILLGGNATPVSFSNPFPVSGSVGIQIGGLAATLANPVPVSGAVGTLVGGVPISAANPSFVGNVYEASTQILSGSTVRQVYHMFGDFNSSGSANQILAPQGANNRIAVLSAHLMCLSAVNVRWLSTGSAGSITNISGLVPLPANGGFVLPHNPHGWFKTNANEGLNLSLSAAGGVGVILTYTIFNNP